MTNESAENDKPDSACSTGDQISAGGILQRLARFLLAFRHCLTSPCRLQAGISPAVP